MFYKKVFINNKEIKETKEICLSSFSDNTINLIIDRDSYTILPLRIRFGIGLHIEGYEITNPDKPKFFKIYLEN